MTELIVGSRCSGKTTELIKKSAKEGFYILTGTHAKARYIHDQARTMGYAIPYPVTLDEFRKGRFKGSHVREDGMLIDDLDSILPHILDHIPIKAVTWNDEGNMVSLDESQTKTTDVAYTERRVARDILSMIEKICFTQEYLDYRVRYGSNGQRNLIIQMIKDKYGVG